MYNQHKRSVILQYEKTGEIKTLTDASILYTHYINKLVHTLIKKLRIKKNV